MNGHPCDTCLRWAECNGIDVDSCQLVKAHMEKEAAPTFLAKKRHVPVVHVTAEEMAKIMESGALIRGRIIV